mmetsp:Transcript_7254/g.30865  ORF Transcript_7254/g.30865 Transcript_7254/m.30865 type:complete len:168 (+) Transcript_7254:262-765(+)
MASAKALLLCFVALWAWMCLGTAAQSPIEVTIDGSVNCASSPNGTDFASFAVYEALAPGYYLASPRNGSVNIVGGTPLWVFAMRMTTPNCTIMGSHPDVCSIATNVLGSSTSVYDTEDKAFEHAKYTQMIIKLWPGQPGLYFWFQDDICVDNTGSITVSLTPLDDWE